MRDEARARCHPRRPGGNPKGGSSGRKVNQSVVEKQFGSPREKKLRAKQRSGVLDPQTLLSNFQQRYRFTCQEARDIFDTLGGQRSRSKTVGLKAFAKVVSTNASYTDGRMDYSSAERLYELFLWAQPVHLKSTINICEACSVLAALSNETLIERLNAILYFVSSKKGDSRENRCFNEKEVVDAMMCFMSSSMLVTSALAMRVFKVKTKSANRIEATYRMDATLMVKQVAAFGHRIWNSEHRKFGRLYLQHVYSQALSADGWGEQWPEYWSSKPQRGNPSGSTNFMSESNDQLIATWAMYILTPIETRLVGAAKQRIRPLPAPLVPEVVERAQMSQEELATKQYLANLKWLEEERMRALEREAWEREAMDREFLWQLSYEKKMEEEKLRKIEEERQRAEAERKQKAAAEAVKSKKQKHKPQELAERRSQRMIN